MVTEVAWTNLASITTDTCPFGPILANHCSKVQFQPILLHEQRIFWWHKLKSDLILTLYMQISISIEFICFKHVYYIEHIQKKKRGELGRQVTNPVFAIGEKPVALLPGIDPFSLFLSNLSSTRFCSLPSSGGMFPVSPLECKFLQEMKKSCFSLSIKEAAKPENPKYTTKQSVSYITLTLLSPLSSAGMGPASRLAPKSKTLRFLSEPSCLGIVPKRRLWSKYLPKIVTTFSEIK